jgi:hypothetical protein
MTIVKRLVLTINDRVLRPYGIASKRLIHRLADTFDLLLDQSNLTYISTHATLPLLKYDLFNEMKITKQ